MKFTEFSFKTYIQEALEDLKFVEATEVQEKLIPVVLSGRDLVGESKTGSGKTHTFLLPIFQKLNEDEDHVQVSNRSKAAVRAFSSASSIESSASKRSRTF